MNPAKGAESKTLSTKSNITKVLQLDTTKHALPCLIVVTSPTPPNPTTILT
jgi:hypothetical protein